MGAITFQQMSLNEPLVFPDAHFDHIINISVLQVVADPDWTLRELARVLKPGGTLLLLHVPRPAYHVLSLREEIRACYEPQDVAVFGPQTGCMYGAETARC